MLNVPTQAIEAADTNKEKLDAAADERESHFSNPIFLYHAQMNPFSVNKQSGGDPAKFGSLVGVVSLPLHSHSLLTSTQSHRSK